MSEAQRIENIAQYSLEFVGNDLILTLKKASPASAGDVILQPATVLNISYKNLTTLPDDLPPSLKTLYCFNNQITILPDNLPQSLEELACSNNQLTTLPDILPQNLQHLHCGDNQITALPDILPQHLRLLYCNNNELSILPNLPQSLLYIDLQNNPLEANYPKIFTFNKTSDIVAYVNQRNAEMLADAKKQIADAQALIAKFSK